MTSILRKHLLDLVNYQKGMHKVVRETSLGHRGLEGGNMVKFDYISLDKCIKFLKIRKLFCF